MKNITDKLMPYMGTVVVGTVLGYIAGEHFGKDIVDLFAEYKTGAERAAAGDLMQLGLTIAGAVAGPAVYYMTSKENSRLDTTSK